MNLLNKKEIWLPIALLIVIGGFVYSFNLNNELFWDDDDWIINNNFVHTISWDNVKFWFSNNVLAGVGLQSNYYRPFLFFTFALNWVVSETKPFLWHFVSNSIHIANAVLVFVLLRRVLATSDVRGTSDVKRSGHWVAFLTALFFLVHPLNTEAVAYISGRGDPLSVFFMLLALWLWITTLNVVMGSYQQRHSVSLRVLSVVSVVFAILSRETGVIFPFLLMVFCVSFICQDRFVKSLKKAFFEALPYFGVVAVYGILRLTVLNFQNTLNFYAAPNAYSENIIYRLFTFMHVLVDYFRLLFVPAGLHMERSMVVHTSLFQWPVWLGATMVAAIIWVGVVLYRKNKLAISTEFLDRLKHGQETTPRDGRGTSDVKIWLFGWVWFFIGLAMVSGITPINALIYEHWLYLPMIGFWFIVSFCLVKLFDHLKPKRSLTTLNVQRTFNVETLGYWLVSIGLIIYLSFFGYQSIQRNILWGNPVEFYENILKYEPGSVRINNNLGNQYFNQGNMEQAEFYYRKAAESGNTFAQPHFNIGSILQSRGDIEGAIVEFNRAIEIDPNFYYPYQNLAVIYAQQGNLVKASENMEKLKQLLPNNPRVYYNSALVYIALNNKEQALEDLNEGLKYSEFDPETGRLIKALIEELEK